MFGLERIKPIERKIDKLMSLADDILAAQKSEKEDLAAMTGLVKQLLTAAANPSQNVLTPEQAQSLLNEMNDEDSTIKSTIASVSAALPPVV